MPLTTSPRPGLGGMIELILESGDSVQVVQMMDTITLKILHPENPERRSET